MDMPKKALEEHELAKFRANRRSPQKLKVEMLRALSKYLVYICAMKNEGT